VTTDYTDQETICKLLGDKDKQIATLTRERDVLRKMLSSKRDDLRSMLDRIANNPEIADRFHAPGEECVADGVEGLVDDFVRGQADLAAAVQQVSRLTEAIQSEANDMLATGNDRAEHTAARRRLLLSVLTPPAAARGGVMRLLLLALICCSCSCGRCAQPQPPVVTTCGEDGGEPCVYAYINNNTIIGTPITITELHVYRPEEWDGGHLSAVVVHYLDGGTCSCPVNGGDR